MVLSIKWHRGKPGAGGGTRSSSEARGRPLASTRGGEAAQREDCAGATWPETAGFQGEGSYRAGRSRLGQVPGLVPGRTGRRVARNGLLRGAAAVAE